MSKMATLNLFSNLEPNNRPVLIVLAFTVTFLSNFVKAAPSYTELEILTPLQKTVLKKFKASVSPIVPHDYMKEEIYLVKWLQATDFSLRKADVMLKDAIDWRTEVSVDRWDDPTFFADIKKIGSYKMYLDGMDRVGRPVLEAHFGKWNIGSIAANNEIGHFTHYCLRGVERATRKIRKFQAEGNNITQFVMLFNMEGFNALSDACPTCMPLYLDFVTKYETTWPNTMFRFILINTPETFDMTLRLMKPQMSSRTRAAVSVFGADKSEWKPFLDELIDPREISDWYDSRGKRRST